MTRSLRHVPAILVMAFALSGVSLQAQYQAPSDAEMVLRVKGLSSSARDAIATELRDSGSAVLVYACVPAGILVIAPTAGSTIGEVRDEALTVAGRHAARKDISDAGMDRQQAEQQCAQARGQ